MTDEPKQDDELKDSPQERDERQEIEESDQDFSSTQDCSDSIDKQADAPQDELSGLLNGVTVKLDSLTDDIHKLQELAKPISLLECGLQELKKASLDNQKLYEERVAYGNRNKRLIEQMMELFKKMNNLEERCVALEGNMPDEATWQGICRNIHSLHKAAIRRLNANGIIPICPKRNDPLDEELHKVVHQIVPESENDKPGHIAEVWEIGEMRDGIVWKSAEVTVFQEQPVEEANETNNGNAERQDMDVEQ